MLVVVVPMINLDVDWGSLDASALVWVGVALIAAAVVGLVIAALVPSLRARLAPPAHAALTNVRGLPGGIGVAEAGLTAGLVAVGIPEETALAAALIHRLLTYYLPPVWGFWALRWLGRHGFV